MRIGIDARLIGQTGVGRYIRNLLRELSIEGGDHEYIVFLRKQDIGAFIIPNARWKKIEADVPWHSVTEQIIMPWLFYREHLDVLHVPYFNVPIFYPGKYIVTIHDVTILHVNTGKASTLPYWFYKIRRIGYRIILFLGIYRATRVIAVSETVKHEIISRFNKPGEKVTVTYEGIEPEFLLKSRFGELENFLYVGNVYPHKNVEILLQAYLLYKNSVKDPKKLIFVGPADYFYEQLRALISSLGLNTYVNIIHNLADSELHQMYASAIALLLPSRLEGFGLPGLEALASGCRVICSDIPVFHEILGSNAMYVDTTSPIELANSMKEISRQAYNRELFQKSSLKFLSKYNWNTMARETRQEYEKVGSET